MRVVRLLLIVAPLLAASYAHALGFANVEEVPFTEKDSESGLEYVVTMSGKKWSVHRSETHKQVFFSNLETKEAVWEDPRTLPLTDEERAALPPEQHEALLNEEALAAEKLRNMAKQSMPGSSKESMTVMMVAVAPVVLFASALVARIWYLMAYCPELLFPTKERKTRFRSAKLKPQKARGKMSQDGKGGRSANS